MFLDVKVFVPSEIPPRPRWLTMDSVLVAASKIVDDLIRCKVFHSNEQIQSISDIITACRFDPRMSFLSLAEELYQRLSALTQT